MVTGDPRSQAVETNVSSFLLEMGRVGGGRERRDTDVVWTVGGSPIGYHNAVVQCDAPGPRADELIEEWAAELARLGLPGSWHVTPSMGPRDLAGRLAARGFEDGGEEPAMVADLLVAPPAPRPLGGFDVEPVDGPAGLGDYRRVLAGGFGEGAAEADWAAGVFGRIGFGDEVPWRHYVGRLAGEPACTASLFLTPPVAGIYFVCTSPRLRRRGLGAAVTSHAMAEARALGCSTAVLGSSPMGHGVYRALGFDEVFRYRIWEWPFPRLS